jgi:hypothetical protein
MEKTKKLPLLPRSIVDLIVSFACNKEQELKLEFIEQLEYLEETIMDSIHNPCMVTCKLISDHFRSLRNANRIDLNEKRNINSQLALEEYELLSDEEEEEED